MQDLNTCINKVYGRELNSACQMDEENSLSTNTASKRKKLIPGVDTRKLNFSKEVSVTFQFASSYGSTYLLATYSSFQKKCRQI